MTSAATPPPRERLLAWVAAACVVALFVPLFIPWATGRVFTLDDLAQFHIPVRFLFSEALAAGDQT